MFNPTLAVLHHGHANVTQITLYKSAHRKTVNMENKPIKSHMHMAVYLHM
jgi:hypothetical protein